ncbi:BAR adaptor protein Hob1 [Rhodotorula toruloides]
MTTAHLLGEQADLVVLAAAPHMIGSKVGMGKQSVDAETNELVRKFSGLEEYTAKLVKDSSSFSDSVASMLTSGAGFATAFSTLFNPLVDEGSLTARHPEAEVTLRNIDHYHELMAELRDAIQPELELVDARVTAPLKEYQELLKKIRKTITKREHKLVDYDRHNNSYNKLKDKKEKSLSDEKNLFKYEQELEIATQEYEHYNNMLKAEIPHFLALSTSLISPIFQTFYYIEIGILYTLLDKLQAFATSTYGADALAVDGLETMHHERMGDVPERIEALSITKRFTSTAKFMSQHRANSDSETGSLHRASSTYSSSSLGRSGTSSSFARPAASDAAPPAYSPPAVSPGLAGKRPPPPPPPGRPGAAAKKEYVTALYDYTAQAGGDLSFRAGDKIEIVKRTESDQDWWTGRLNGQEGQFPANYVDASK